MEITPIMRRCKLQPIAAWTSTGPGKIAGSRRNDACGCSGDFLASAFPCDLKRDCFTCPAGKPFLHSFLSPDFPVDGPDRAPLKTAKGAAPSTQQESCSLTTPSFLSRGPQLVGAGRKNRYGKRGGPPGPLINDRPDLIQR